MADKKYRYPGVQPFKTSDQDIFFGRNEDREKLYNLIQLEKLVVLFGKSGYGKSSLLNAGIMPLLTDSSKQERMRFMPIEVRLGNFSPQTSLAPLETLKIKLDEKFQNAGDWNFLDKTSESDTLWAAFKRKQTQQTQRIVLVFDQFEEFFSYPIEQQEAFRWQLAELLFTDIPQSLRDKSDTLTDEQFNRLSEPMNIKIVFSIRADRMSLMDGLKDALPTILHKRYELKSLSPAQAREAIEKPARIDDKTFSTPPFEYTESAMSRIIHELTSEQTRGVEAFQLQIVCEEIEKTVEQGGVTDSNNKGLLDVGVEHLPNFKNLYENYYRRKLSELDATVSKAAQLVLEDGLLANDAATGEGRRMSIDSRALIRQFYKLGLTDKVLTDLEKTYLIRREINTVGGFSFEISHDTLVAPIQKAKVQRRAVEEKERIKSEQIEKEKLLAEAQRQAEIERKRRRRATALAIASGILFLVSAFFGYIALRQKLIANDATKKAVLQKVEADKNFQLAQQSSFEAKRNADSATLARIDAEKNYKLALEQKGIATDALKKAEENFKKAKAAEANALAEQEKTKRALDDAQAANVRVISIYLKDVEQYILRLEYDSAFEKCQTALGFKVESQKDTITKRILEIAYFYTEADTLEAAVKTLQLLKINAAANRKDLETAIKNANPQLFTFFENRYYPTMMPVEGGTFAFGGKNANDSISHEVKVSSFNIAKTETTFWQYNLFAKATHNYISPPSWQYAGDNPAVNVSWYDAVAYSNWLSRRKNKKEFYDIDSTQHKQSEWLVAPKQTQGFRLPTEPEWEFAARGGNETRGFEYSGDSILNNVAWTYENSNSRTHSVATKKENELHLKDMTGNVWEWCFDWYADSLNISDEKLWVSPEKGSDRVYRGGGWNNYPQGCRASYRYGDTPTYRNYDLGFRVASALQ